MKAICAVILVSLCLHSGAVEVRGRVLDPDGNPVGGAEVWLTRERIVSTATTDDAGAFEFLNVRAGWLSVTARKEGFALTGLTGHVYDDLAVDLHLAMPDTVRIRVIDHAGKPLEGARVKHLVVGGAFEVHVSDLAQHGFPSIRSDEDGAVAIPGMPEGSYVTVTLEHRNFCDLTLPFLVPGEHQHPAQLYPGQVLRGRISAPDSPGTAHARVLLFQEPQEGQRMLLYDVLADAEGYYRTMVTPGSYIIEAHHPDHPMPKPETVRLADSLEDTVMDFALSKAHTVEGTVVGPEAAPMPGVLVQYIIDNFTQDEAFTDRNGAFRLTVSAGSGRVRVVPPRGYMTAETLDVVVHMEAVEHTRISAIALEALPVLRGRIVNADDEPQAAVLVRTMNLNAPLFALSDDAGVFEIPLEAMPDEEAVELRAEHTLRFLRRDFTIGLREQEGEVIVRLRRFEPDLRPDEPGNAPNDLSRLAGKPAPPLTCRAWINAEEITLEDLKGSVVVLFLWAGFDPFGINAATIAELTLLHQALAGAADDVAFVGVHDDSDPPAAVRRYVAEYGIEFPVGVDASPMITLNRYDTRVLPQVVLLDKRGVVRSFDVENRLPELIKDLRRRP